MDYGLVWVKSSLECPVHCLGLNLLLESYFRIIECYMTVCAKGFNSWLLLSMRLDSMIYSLLCNCRGFSRWLYLPGLQVLILLFLKDWIMLIHSLLMKGCCSCFCIDSIKLRCSGTIIRCPRARAMLIICSGDSCNDRWLKNWYSFEHRWLLLLIWIRNLGFGFGLFDTCSFSSSFM